MDLLLVPPEPSGKPLEFRQRGRAGTLIGNSQTRYPDSTRSHDGSSPRLPQSCVAFPHPTEVYQRPRVVCIFSSASSSNCSASSSLPPLILALAKP
jgi:hypothetical protein